MYRQVGAALLLPHSLAAVLRHWHTTTGLLADTPRKRKRYGYFLG